MVDIKRVENELHKAIYIFRDANMYEDIWNIIKNDPRILREAIKVIRDKYDEADTLQGLTIADTMLKQYEFIDEKAYKELVQTIFSNKDIARTVVDGASNGGYSFLLMALWNYNFKLTEEQKNFAVDEAMNKYGTTRWRKNQEDYSKKLDEMGITDEDTAFINIDGSVNPIGRKLGSKYLNDMFSLASRTQAHGSGDFDIRYYILRNPNWTETEKQKLVYDFWYDDDSYDEALEQWEWNIVNDRYNYQGMPFPQLEKEYLYDYTYEELLEFYNGNEEVAKRIFAEITFCKLMHNLRPQKWEKVKVKEKSN